jgi:glycosyltransferase involved in cell wall biosynthesis
MPHPQVSVIIPVYNAEKYIGEAIQSILNQTYKDFELIIIDDASTDKTPEIVSKYNDPRIKIYTNEKNLYIAGNRNKGIGLASGKYIVWQDADDISMSDRIELEYKLLESDPKIGICGSYLEIFDNSGTLHLRKYKTTDAEVRKTIFRYSPVAQPSAMIRKECFDKVGLYNLGMPPAEDIEMSFRIGQFYKFANIPKPLIKYRVHESSATFEKLKLIEKNTLETRYKFKDNIAYKFTTYDYVYNFLQKITLYLMPAKFRIDLFNFIRRFNIV